MKRKKLILRIFIGFAAIIIVALLGIAFFPASPYQPPDRDLKDESALSLDAKTGWYLLPDESERLLTWGPENGMIMYGFGESRDDLKRISFSASTADKFVSRSSTAPKRLEFIDDFEALLIDPQKETQLILRSETPPYETREVTFNNGNIQLSGLHFVPSGPGPHPAVTFIHGSGVSDRDGFWYLSPADYLAKHGIMVLLPDKRGAGKSQGEWHTASFEDFAEDALAGVELLRQQDSVDSSRIGLMGFSQGGWIAPLAASKSESVAFAISVSASAAKPNEQLNYEVRNEIAGSGAPGFVASALAPLFARRAKMPRKFWWELNGQFNPISYWSNLNIPVLMIYGERDANVNVQRSLARLNAVGVLDRPGIEIKLFPNLAHGLIREDSGWLDPEYLECVEAFINQGDG
ncbi:MAG: alpha/beta fold hydrolase, partial [Hellea sp.]|nr:alpha/beta fold hydrolase [Hellea sp.]